MFSSTIELTEPAENEELKYLSVKKYSTRNEK